MQCCYLNVFVFVYINECIDVNTALKKSFKSTSCSGRKHQFPRNFLCWPAPGCIYILSNLCIVWCSGEKFPWNNIQLRIPNLPPSRLDFCTIIDIDYQLVVGGNRILHNKEKLAASPCRQVSISSTFLGDRVEQLLCRQFFMLLVATAFAKNAPKYAAALCKSCSLKNAVQFQQNCWQNRTPSFALFTLC
jgi:hypothetical protein